MNHASCAVTSLYPEMVRVGDCSTSEIGLQGLTWLVTRRAGTR
jgi:hypothetical protein